MRRCASAAITVGLLFVGAAAAWADPITVTRDQRATWAVANFFNEGHGDRAQSGDRLVSTVTVPAPGNGGASATLTSSFGDPLHWYGTGTADTSWVPPAGDGQFGSSKFIINFNVVSPVSYAFNENVSVASSGCCVSDVVGAQAISFLRVNTGRLDREGDPIFDTVFDFRTPFATQNSSSTTAYGFGGLLSPGEYFLFLDGSALGPSPQGAGSASANFAFTLDFAPSGGPSPTPEPPSLLLLGTGMAGVFGFRSRSARRTR